MGLLATSSVAIDGSKFKAVNTRDQQTPPSSPPTIQQQNHSRTGVLHAFTTMVRQWVDALVVKPDPFFIYRHERLVALAASHAIPAIYPLRVFVETGGLMSYGTNFVELYEQIGICTGKILRGTRPVDLPVQQSIKFELVINLKIAKALSLTVPPSLLARADEVIERGSPNDRFGCAP
jgi:ABC-type uncharacterized transport system substrate-binding protein